MSTNPKFTDRSYSSIFDAHTSVIWETTRNTVIMFCLGTLPERKVNDEMSVVKLDEQAAGTIFRDKLNSLRPYFIPSHLPSFIRRPPRVKGMPVFFDTRLLALVTPSARFHENDKPGPSFIQPPESTPT